MKDLTNAVVNRLALGVLLLLVVTFGVFVLVSLIPGDPAEVLAGDNQSLVPYIRQSLHLNQSLIQQYWIWLSQALHGNLGQSYVLHESVDSVLANALPVTAGLIVLSLIIATAVSIVAGLASALRAGGLLDRSITGLAAVAIAAPPFWIGYLLVLWFAVDLKWFPALGYAPLSAGLPAWLEHLILPAATLSLWPAATLTLQLRAVMLDVLREDYILSANAKGLSAASVLGKHALKNAAGIMVTVLGFQLAQLIGGTVIIETVFALPGLGGVAVSSSLNRDVPVMLGLVVLTTIIVIIVNFLVDLSCTYFNPKVRMR